jgi:hypothetical protein
MKTINNNNKTVIIPDKTSGVGFEFSKQITKLLLNRITKLNRIMCKVIAVLILLGSTITYGYSKVKINEPNKSIIYNIVRNDIVIGKIKINQTVSGDSIIYTIESDVKGKFILKFKVVGKEKYIYKNGTLIYSSLFRTLNDKVKTNNCIIYNKGEYSFQSPEGNKSLNFEIIKQNLMTLFINEPIGIESVFCDNQQQMVKVKPIGKGIYKVELSNGKYNIFHYKNGRCIKIEAVSPLFDVTLIPVQS